MRARRQNDGQFRITPCATKHTCAMGPSGPNIAIVKKIAREQMQYAAAPKSLEIASRARVDYGITVSYKKAHGALRSVGKDARETSARSYGLIAPWLQGMDRLRVIVRYWVLPPSRVKISIVEKPHSSAKFC